MIRAHDALVRRALKDKCGREVKHTGDGIMASFDDTMAAIECARAIQQAFDAFNLASKENPAENGACGASLSAGVQLANGAPTTRMKVGRRCSASTVNSTEKDTVFSIRPPFSASRSRSRTRP